jgi:hypothetical protein
MLSLSLLTGLKQLAVCWSEELTDVLPVICRNLVSFVVWGADSEAWLAAFDCPNSPNLEHLSIRGSSLDEDNLASLCGGGLKKRLKKLKSSIVDKGGPFRLGTDWVGYEDFRLDV